MLSYLKLILILIDMKKIELMVPAGNVECLKAAVDNGADSVYLGLSKFGARKKAGFSLDELKYAIKFCHCKGVKVYATFNTLVKNSEISYFFELMKEAYNLGIDAVIVQELSFIPIIKKNFPGLEVHVSTQANIHNSNSFGLLEKADRVTLARELKYDEIKNIRKNTKKELEIFVHGALCFCYSGKCLMSSMIGGRSGNRGNCAQPCRRRYNGRYLLSTKDLCLIEKIPSIIELGIDAVKVEGRLRSKNYVSTVTRIYRKAIDSYYSGKFSVSEKDIEELKLVFNREFTQGSFSDEKNIVSDEKPMNRGLFLGTYVDGKIKLKTDISSGDGIGIWKKDKVIGSKIKSIIVDGKKVKNAKKGDLVELNIKNAEGNKIYKTSGNIVSDYKIMPKKEIKVLREKVNNADLPKIKNNFNKDNKKIFCKVYNKKDALELKDKADIIYYPISEDAKFVRTKFLDSKTKFFVSVPHILFDHEIDDLVEKIKKIDPDGILTGNIGLLDKKLGIKYEIHLDYQVNVFNDYDMEFYKGVPVVSPELNLNELRNFRNKNLIVYAHGKIIDMTTRYKIKENRLVDEIGAKFDVEDLKEGSIILHNKEIGFLDEVKKLFNSGIKYILLDLRKDAEKTFNLYSKIVAGYKVKKNLKKGFTLGHLKRGV